MPKWCAVGSCNNHHQMLDEISGRQKYRFFQFPSSQKQKTRRDRWALACGRFTPGSRLSWKPKDEVVGVYVCSTHFISGGNKPPPLSDIDVKVEDIVGTRNAMIISGCPATAYQPNHPDYIPTKKLHLKSAYGTPVYTDEQKLRRFSSSVKRRLPDITNTTKKCKARRAIIPDVPLLKENTELGVFEILRDSDDDMETPEHADRPFISVLPTPGTAKFIPTFAQVVISGTDQHHLFEEVSKLQQQRDQLQADLDFTNARLNTVRLGVHLIESNDTKCFFYTSLTWKIFHGMYDSLVDVTYGKGIPIIPHMDQLFFTLVKLKHNPKFEYLADQAGISQSTMIDHFWKWVDIIHTKLDWLVSWPERDFIHKVIPPNMKALYPKLTCIIDCFEIFVEAPGNLKARAQLWSNYKKHTTIKFLIGCTALGAVSFLSKAWGGRASDIVIVRKSGFMTRPNHLPGDQILADRGFTMQDEFAALAGVILITPAFIKGQDQFSSKDIETSRQVSSVRIHIERVIGAIKNRFAILQGTLPLRLIKSLKDEAENADLTSADKLISVCSILANLHSSIIYNE